MAARAPRRTTAACVALLLAVASLAACSDDGAGGGSDGSSAASLVGALEELPRVGDLAQVQLTWTDLAAARQANGLDGPPDPDDEDAVEDFVATMTGVGDDSVVVAQLGAFDRELVPQTEGLGFDWTTSDAVAAVLAGGESLGWYSAADDVEPGPGLEALDDDDLFSRDDDLFVAVDGPESVLSDEEDAVRAWRADEAETLADEDALVPVAQALDDADAISAVVVSLGERGLVGMGWVDDDGDPAFVIVYGLGDGTDADDARDTLAAGFEGVVDLLDVDEIRVQGDLVVVTGHQVDDIRMPLMLLQTARLPLPS